MLRSLHVHFRFQDNNIRKISVLFIPIQSSTDNKSRRSRHHQKIDLHVGANDAIRWLVEHDAELERRRAAARQNSVQKLEGASGIDDVFDAENVTLVDGVAKVEEHADFAGRFRSGAVRRKAEKLGDVRDLVTRESTTKIGHEDKGAFENADDDERVLFGYDGVAVVVVLGRNGDVLFVIVIIIIICSCIDDVMLVDFAGEAIDFNAHDFGSGDETFSEGIFFGETDLLLFVN